jgi:DNA-binding NarL/FixJ family response regulator
MAASGMTNREIAHGLVVTVKTVETHLSHAYCKLEIKSRRHLARALRGHEPGLAAVTPRDDCRVRPHPGG